MSVLRLLSPSRAGPSAASVPPTCPHSSAGAKEDKITIDVSLLMELSSCPSIHHNPCRRNEGHRVIADLPDPASDKWHYPDGTTHRSPLASRPDRRPTGRSTPQRGPRYSDASRNETEAMQVCSGGSPDQVQAAYGPGKGVGGGCRIRAEGRDDGWQCGRDCAG